MFIATAISLAVILLPQAITFADDSSSINQKALDFVICRCLQKSFKSNVTERN
jgi:hypothetical protein